MKIFTDPYQIMPDMLLYQTLQQLLFLLIPLIIEGDKFSSNVENFMAYLPLCAWSGFELQEQKILSWIMTKCKKWPVRPAKTLTSLAIHPVWWWALAKPFSCRRQRLWSDRAYAGCTSHFADHVSPCHVTCHKNCLLRGSRTRLPCAELHLGSWCFMPVLYD